MKKIRTNKKTAILSVIMLFVMLFTCLSNVITSYAETSDETEELQSGNAIVSEAENKRGEFERHYLTGDGSYIAVSYSDPVNYQDENGEWIAVDNTLKSNLLTGSMTSQNEKYKVKFANKANNDKLVSIKTDDYDISWGITVSEDGESFSELNKVKGRIDVKNSNALPKTTEEATELGKAVSTAIYENVYGDFLDVRYTVTHGKIKEDVILKERSDFQSYKVAYNINEAFKATLKSDGSVTVEDKYGEVLFIIGAPWMSDADGACSDDISVKLLISSKTLEVIYTPSSEWLSADDRAYPVTIDPDITSRRYTGNITDISAYYGYVTDLATAPTSPTMTLGADYDVFIKMSAGTNLPNNAYVLGSSLIMYGYSLTNHLPEDYYIYDLSVEIHQIDSYWDEYWFSDWSPDYDYGDYTPYSESNPMYYISYATYSYSQCVTDTYTYPAVRFELEIPEYFVYEYGSYPQYFAQYNGFKISMSYWADTAIISSENTQYPTCRPAIITRYSYTAPGISANTMYKIKNVGSGKYLTVSDSPSNVYQSQTNVNGSQVIRVTYNTANNYYRLTPFYDRNAYIGYTDDMTDYQATYKNVTTNAATNNFESWVIVPDGDYLRICSANYPQYALTAVGTVNGTPSGTTNTSGNIFVSSNNSSNAFQKWVFEKCEYQGNIESSSNTLLIPVNTLAYFSAPLPGKQWHSSNEDVAIIDQNGKLRTYSGGYTEITWKYGNTTHTYVIEVLYPTASYLIKRDSDGKYATISNGEGIVISVQGDYNTQNQFPYWQIEHVESGFYKITKQVGALTLALTHWSDYVVSFSQFIEGNIDQLWKITHVTPNTVKIESRYSVQNSLNLVLASHGDNNTDHSNTLRLIPYSSESDNTLAKWQIVTNELKVVLLNVDASNLVGEDGYTSSVISSLQRVYDKSQILNLFEGYYTENTMINYLQTAEIAVISSHGSKEAISRHTDNTVCLTINDLKYTDFDNLKFLVLLNCFNAQGFDSHTIVSPPEDYAPDYAPINILDTFVYRGVQNVIGFNASLGVIEGNQFISILFDKLTGGTQEDSSLPLNSNTPTLYQALQNITTTPDPDEGGCPQPETMWVIGGNKTYLPIFHIYQ